jgi:hypothetical protein
MIKNSIRPTYIKAIKIYDIEIFKKVDVTIKLMTQCKLSENNAMKINMENVHTKLHPFVSIKFDYFSTTIKCYMTCLITLFVYVLIHGFKIYGQN